MSEKSRTKGMVLGKFMPPHMGHQYLVQTAQNYVDDLCIVVGSLKSEPIDGALRVQWMRTLFPQATVVHHTAENPQLPEEHPEFWRIWRESLRAVLPWPVDFVFAGELYGARLASELGARFVPVPRAENTVPMSATQVRSAPFTHWDMIPPCVRGHYAKRVAIVGPESTGKSTLALNLAKHYHSLAVPEHARALIELDPTIVQSLDGFQQISKGQRATESALATLCNKILFCDTDVLSTTVWREKFFRDAPVDSQLAQWAQDDQYALTLLCSPDVPWVQDQVRYFPTEGVEFFRAFQRALAKVGRPYVVLSGDWEQRFSSAVQAVDSLFE